MLWFCLNSALWMWESGLKFVHDTTFCSIYNKLFWAAKSKDHNCNMTWFAFWWHEMKNQFYSTNILKEIFFKKLVRENLQNGNSNYHHRSCSDNILDVYISQNKYIWMNWKDSQRKITIIWARWEVA